MKNNKKLRRKKSKMK